MTMVEGVHKTKLFMMGNDLGEEVFYIKFSQIKFLVTVQQKTDCYYHKTGQFSIFHVKI